MRTRWIGRYILGTCLVIGTAQSVLAMMPSEAAAQTQHDIKRPFTGTRPLQLDIHAGVSWWGVGFATGARFGIPVMDNGFVNDIDNAVYINFGGDFYWIRAYDRDNRAYGVGVGIPVALHWEFYFSEEWSAFAELGINFFLFHPRFVNDGDFFFDPGFWFMAAIGGRYRFSDAIGITLRLGSPYAAFGVVFEF